MNNLTHRKARIADLRAWGAMEQLWEAIHNCSYG